MLTIFHLIFQVYKISNLNVDDHAIYLKGASLYEIIKYESEIITAAKEYDPSAVEMQFNDMVEAVANDFNTDLTEGSTSIKRNIIVNFADLFELAVDIKKTRSESAATAAADNIEAEKADE